MISAGSHHVTHVLLQEGHLWGHRQVAIPMTAVASTADGIRLTIARHQVLDLPPIDITRPEIRSDRPGVRADPIAG